MVSGADPDVQTPVFQIQESQILEDPGMFGFRIAMLLSHCPLREVGMCSVCIDLLRVGPLPLRLGRTLWNNVKLGQRF